MSEVQTLTGRLLLAMPGMGDPRFDHAVIAMCVHDANGALGIGIGKLHPGLRFHQLLGNVGLDPGEAPDAPVHNGGPVEMQRGFLLHSPEWRCEDTIVVEGQYGLSASLEALRAITRGEGPARWVFALGYAGWGPGQLDGEMQRTAGTPRKTTTASCSPPPPPSAGPPRGRPKGSIRRCWRTRPGGLKF